MGLSSGQREQRRAAGRAQASEAPRVRAAAAAAAAHCPPALASWLSLPECRQTQATPPLPPAALCQCCTPQRRRSGPAALRAATIVCMRAALCLNNYFLVSFFFPRRFFFTPVAPFMPPPVHHSSPPGPASPPPLLHRLRAPPTGVTKHHPLEECSGAAEPAARLPCHRLPLAASDGCRRCSYRRVGGACDGTQGSRSGTYASRAAGNTLWRSAEPGVPRAPPSRARPPPERTDDQLFT